MKKILLSAAMLFALTASAQQTFSFEESEGYVAGEIVGQNDWGILELMNPIDNSLVNVSSTAASEGSMGLEFTSDASEWDYYSGVVHPLTSEGTAYDVSFDLYTGEFGLSDHVLYGLYSEDLYFTYAMVFSFNQNIRLIVGESTAWEVVGTWEENTWYNIRISVDDEAGTLTYYINDEEVFTGNTFADAAGLDNIFFGYDNYGSGFVIDNVVVQGAMSVGELNNNLFSVSPNPAKDVLKVTSQGNALTNVAIFDMNGRAVKNVNLNNVLESDINVSDLQTGMYVAKLSSATGSKTVKFAKN